MKLAKKKLSWKINVCCWNWIGLVSKWWGHFCTYLLKFNYFKRCDEHEVNVPLYKVFWHDSQLNAAKCFGQNETRTTRLLDDQCSTYIMVLTNEFKNFRCTSTATTIETMFIRLLLKFAITIWKRKLFQWNTVHRHCVHAWEDGNTCRNVNTVKGNVMLRHICWISTEAIVNIELPSFAKQASKNTKWDVSLRTSMKNIGNVKTIDFIAKQLAVFRTSISSSCLCWCFFKFLKFRMFRGSLVNINEFWKLLKLLLCP